MSIKVYIVTEPTLIDFLVDNDIGGFKAYLNEYKEYNDFILFDEPESFDTEAEHLLSAAVWAMAQMNALLPNATRSARARNPTSRSSKPSKII